MQFYHSILRFSLSSDLLLNYSNQKCSKSIEDIWHKILVDSLEKGRDLLILNLVVQILQNLLHLFVVKLQLLFDLFIYILIPLQTLEDPFWILILKNFKVTVLLELIFIVGIDLSEPDFFEDKDLLLFYASTLITWFHLLVNHMIISEHLNPTGILVEPHEQSLQDKIIPIDLDPTLQHQQDIV